MATRFPESSKLIHSTESEMKHFYDHVMIQEGNNIQKHFSSPRGVAIDTNTNCIYVVENSRRLAFSRCVFTCVSIYSGDGEFLETFSLKQHMWATWGIAIHDDNLYLTDNLKHSVFHFKIAPGFKLVGKVGSLGVCVGCFSSPKQLTVSTNGNLFVADCTNNRVVVLDSNLQYQQCIKHSSMKRPRDLKLISDEVYVLCSRSRVLVFSHVGEILRTICLSFQMNDPLFFCIDGDNNIITTNDRDVRIFSNKGEFLDTLWEISVRGVLESPKGISPDKNGKLIVVMGVSKIMIHIFS